MMDYAQLVDTPNPMYINRGCTPIGSADMQSLFGKPNIAKEKVSAFIANRIDTRDCGPFKATGFIPFLEIVTAVMARIEKQAPRLYNEIGSAGCLCVRNVRGGTSPSNHSWGTAIDLTIAGKLDGLGNGQTQIGLIEVYKHFKDYAKETGSKVFWGAGFHREDSMHFEASEELIRHWAKAIREGSL